MRSILSLLIGGFIILDSGSPIPIPLTGLPSIFLGSSIFFYGWYEWKSFAKLPLREAIMIGKDQEGKISRTDIFLKLKLTSDQTDALLEKLIKEGFIEMIDDDLPLENEKNYRIVSL